MQQLTRGDCPYHYRQGYNLKRRLEAAKNGADITALREKYGRERRGLEKRIDSLERKAIRATAERLFSCQM